MTTQEKEQNQTQESTVEVKPMDQAPEQKDIAVKPRKRTTRARTTTRRPATKRAAAKAVLSADTIKSLDDPCLYINRELSWLEFDRKVLETAMDKKVPLLDRVKFLSIFYNNLDEFYMVRVRNIQTQARSGVAPTGADKVPPIRQLAEIRRKVMEMLDQAEDLWFKELKPAMEVKDIEFLKYDALSGAKQAMLDRFFDTEIFPILTPQAVDAGRPFPMISNTSINFVIELESNQEDAADKVRFARVKCPSSVPRFLFVPENDADLEKWDVQCREGRIVMVEDLIAHRLESLFPGYRVKNYGLFRVTRNTDGEIEEDEADDLLSAVRDYVEQRRFGSIVRLELERGIPQRLQDFLIQHLDLQANQIYKSRMPLAFSEFIRLMGIDRPALKYPPFKANLPSAFDPEGDCFAAIGKRDQMVYHPYDSFGSVLRFLEQAARDPKVVAIKQTLYRCGSDSPIVKSLLEARRRGKQVTAVVELKARFDEEQNINWAEELERQGVNVVYGFAGLKIHAKLCLVVRREANGMKRYVHIGTGNYNASSAKIYTDLGLFTANEDICNDVQDLFNVMTGFGILNDYRQIFVSPKHLRRSLAACIDAEIESHRQNGNGHIILKCNQLVDPAIVRQLYEASQVGVKVECIVRGICSLRPGIPGVSETISVRSIVGELLEHARVYYFHNNGNDKMYVGSADLMSRNLNGRIEVLTPVLDDDIRHNILTQIVKPQLKDNVNAWSLLSDGTYKKSRPKGGAAAYASQSAIRQKLNLLKKR
ncbi:MAG: polyphosphate kinase 1 [Duodenibacillus sp.]|nr:polyphosphate kinase 1 [Duodenibacillus sp.]